MTYVATANSGADSFQTSRSNTKPGGVVSGDVGIFYLGRWNESASFPAVTPPAGAVLRGTLAVGDLQLLVYAKYIAGESSNSFSWAGSRWSGLWSTYFTDVDPGLDLATIPYQGLTGTGTSITTVSVTTVANADLAWGVDCHEYSGGETHGPPTNFTERFDLEYGAAATRVSPGSGSQSASGGTISSSQAFAVALIALAPDTGGGAVDLVIQDALHAHAADNIAFTQVHSLAVQDSRHTHVADNVAFTQVHSLAIQDSAHSHIVDNLAISQNHVLTVQDALHGHIAEQSNFVYNIQLAIQDAMHTHTADVVDYTQVHQLAIHGALHETLADNLSLDGSVTLTIQNAKHLHSADGLVLGQTHILQIQDAHHATKADTVQLVNPGFGGFMTVSDVQMQKLAAATGLTGSISDLERAYYGALSGLSPVYQFSIADHKRVYWEAQTGLTGKSLADLEEAFYDVQLIAAGTNADREFTYWTNL